MPCFWILFPDLGFGLKALGLQDTCHRQCVFQIYLEDKGKKIQNQDGPSGPILRFNLRLTTYSICSAIFIAPYI